MPIKYACINVNGNIFTEFPTTEQQLLAKTLQTVISTVSSKEYRRQTIEDIDMHYHYLSNGDGKIFGCVATKDIKQRVIFDFLDKIEEMCRDKNLDQLLIKEIIKKKMLFYNDPDNDKINSVQKSIDIAKDIMTNNIDAALKRGDRLDTLNTKSENMAASAAIFQKKSSDLKREMCMRNAKMIIMIVGSVLVFILIILLIICRPNFSDCK
jgi:hypothetical protein